MHFRQISIWVSTRGGGYKVRVIITRTKTKQHIKSHTSNAHLERNRKNNFEGEEKFN
jgi:hypothetical protein